MNLEEYGEVFRQMSKRALVRWSEGMYGHRRNLEVKVTRILTRKKDSPTDERGHTFTSTMYTFFNGES